MSDQVLTPDLCVIGGSAAGVALAASAAASGVPAVLVDRPDRDEKRRAADYLALPAFAAAAQQLHAARRMARFGIAAAEPAADFTRLRQGVQERIADLALNYTDARLRALGVGVLRAAYRFVDHRTVAANDVEIRARRFVLALPAVPAIPEIPGLACAGYLTVNRLLEVEECPRHLIVIGAGATGLACAQVFRRLGAEVTVLDAAAPLGTEDPECVAILLDALAGEEIAVRGGVHIERIEKTASGVRAVFIEGETEQSAEGSHLLLATGYRADLHALGLEMAGIEHERSEVLTGSNLRTSNSRVFSIRDEPGAAHIERWHAQLVLQNVLFRIPVLAGDGTLPRAVPTDPEFAHAGLTEEEARQHHRRILVLRAPFGENERAVIERNTTGLMKMIATPRGRILGVTIVGAGAGELIGPYAYAMAKRAKVRSLAGPYFPHPSRGEIGGQAAFLTLARSLTKPWVQRIIALLRQLG